MTNSVRRTLLLVPVGSLFEKAECGSKLRITHLLCQLCSHLYHPWTLAVSSLDCHLRVLMIPWTLNTEEHFLRKLLSLSRMIKSILVETSNLFKNFVTFHTKTFLKVSVWNGMHSKWMGEKQVAKPFKMKWPNSWTAFKRSFLIDELK